ncbi:MAG: 4'-phosphopantetheinyl transferase family protein [Ferruginibacter sp.]
MPLVFQQNINDTSTLGIWKIEENLAFFEAVPTIRTFRHEALELGHRSCRQIIRTLSPDIDLELLAQDAHGRPVHKTAAVDISFSHTRGWSAALLTKENRCGVDIEAIGEKAVLVQSKFLIEEDKQVLHALPFHDECHYTLAWSLKETVFKWYGKGAVDFKKQIRLLSVETMTNNHIMAQIEFSREAPRRLTVYGLVHDEYVLTWLIAREN